MSQALAVQRQHGVVLEQPAVEVRDLLRAERPAVRHRGEQLPEPLLELRRATARQRVTSCVKSRLGQQARVLGEQAEEQADEEVGGGLRGGVRAARSRSARLRELLRGLLGDLLGGLRDRAAPRGR